MTGWGTFIADGVEYPLGHLDSFSMPVTPKVPDAKTLYVLVSFGHHTFAREVRDGDPDHMIITKDGDARCFCPTRYAQSLDLRKIIEGAAGGKAYFGQEKPGRAQNYLLIENLPGLGGPYVVYFNAERSKERNIDVAMFVTSAHEKPGLRPNIGRITFASLIGTVAAGKTPKRPPKRW